MIRIGILGDIGSGKTYVARQFGYPVFNADNEVTKLYRTNRRCFNVLKKKFPSFVFSFPIKKFELSNAINRKKKNLKIIEKIIHPEIQKKMKKFIKKNKNKKIVILDIPLFMENRLNKKNDILIFVDPDKKEANKRLKKRINFSKKMIKKLKKTQFSLNFKKRHSNFIIKNNFKRNDVKKNVKKVLKKILLHA
tara:strand:- start:484 stop:1062 length:579 start_codon:yes stop_codon:yes gene_type:complete